MKRSFQIYLFFFIALFLASCRDKKSVDVSNIDLNIRIERFDRELSTLDQQNLRSKAPELQEKYGNFYSDFMQEMLGAGSTTDTGYYNSLRIILNNPDYRALKSEVAMTFGDMAGREAELTDAFRHVRYYYPEQRIPRLISFFSGFSVQVPVGNDYIGIGLDMFLGADSKFYPPLRQSIPQYISRRFTPGNITPRVLEVFVRENMFPEPGGQHIPLLDRMIYNGRIMYFMSALMPDMPDSVIIGYTPQQQKWCESNEAGIWGYFLEEDLLYEADYMKIQKFLTEAPFTPGIGNGNESAPKLALYSGWQIVKKYMDRNKDVTMQQLMDDTDYQTILTRSRYRPK